VPVAHAAGVRAVCGALPETVEDQPPTGPRWRVRGRTFAQLWALDSPTGSTTLLMFRCDGEELEVLRGAGPPFSPAAWGRDVMVMTLDDDTDWIEVGELLTESYCIRAPKKLVALVSRPPEIGA